MGVNVSELEGALLDYWVARAEGQAVTWNRPPGARAWVGRYANGDYESYCPSEYWDQGGPIIERESIGIGRNVRRSNEWGAWIDLTFNQNAAPHEITGPTPLVAAMRAYVASKFGDTVDDSCAKSLDSRKSQQ